MRHGHLPEAVTPWSKLWPAGQDIDLIDDLPGVAVPATHLRQDYVVAGDLPNFAKVARRVDAAPHAAPAP